jgi:hypothetical protein
MVTVLEEYNNEEQSYVVCFLSSKGLIAKSLHKEMLPVYGGRCLSCKAVHNRVAKSFADDEEVETEVWKWLRQQSKGSHAVGVNV